MIPRNKLPPIEKINAFVQYDPGTGDFTWRHPDPDWFTSMKAWRSWTKKHAGKPAGDIGNHGYVRFMIAGQRMLAHRVAYFIVHGVEPPTLDHRNGVRADNRIVNLREVTSEQNAQNAATRSTNTSGVMGVTACGQKWQAYIREGGRLAHLGFFNTLEEAVAARRSAESRLGYMVRTVH